VAGLFYKEKYRSERFVIYTDHDRGFVERVGPKVEEIYRGYEDIFGIPAERLGRTSIFLEGDRRDEEVVDLGYSPSLLGYYIPFLNMISVDTRLPWTREKVMLDQILLHEVSHHFILTQFPRAGKECWLNEGLAGNLEMTLFEGSRFEYPLLNPILLGISRRAVLAGDSRVELRRLLALGWGDFHDGDAKDLNYALSWSLVYFLLDRVLQPGVSLGERIRTLYRIDRSWIAAQESRFLDFLRDFDLTEALVALAHPRPGSALGKLTPLWAVDQLGTLRFLDEGRALCVLESLLDAPEAALADRARIAFLHALARSVDGAHRPSSSERGRDRVAAILLDPSQPLAQRMALTSALTDLPRVDPRWVPVLIRLLEAPEGEVRAEAARGLGASYMKPTIVNPAFWRHGDPSLRKAEVDEWRAWWAGRQTGPIAAATQVKR
jgi:hypothetical protein